MAFLGRSGGDNIATGGTALSDAGDASGAFTGGSAWRVGFGGESPEQFALVNTNYDFENKNAFFVNWDSTITDSINIGNDAFYFVKYSPDGKYVAAMGINYIKIIELSSLQIVKTLSSPGDFGTLQTSGGYSPIVWSPDGRYLATHGDASSAIFVWDSQNSWANVYDGDYPTNPEGFDQYSFYQLDWSPDGNYLVAIDGDFRLPAVFDTSDWSYFEISVSGFTSANGYFAGAQFTKDGESLYVVGYYVLAGEPSSRVKLLKVDTSSWNVLNTYDLTKTNSFPFGLYISPNSEKIVIADFVLYGFRLFDFSSGTPLEITVDPLGDPNVGFPSRGPAAWRSDSSEFLCLTYDLYRVNATTGSASTVFDDPQITLYTGSVDASPVFTEGTWIGYKFAYPVTPTHIDITASGDSRPRSGVIEYSPDGRTWYALQTIAFA
jgi:hypothetical protein